MPEPEPKPIDEVLSIVKDIVEDVKTIKNDIEVIKNRLHEINRARLREQEERDDIAKGWFW